jgi:hypothetical protein
MVSDDSWALSRRLYRMVFLDGARPSRTLGWVRPLAPWLPRPPSGPGTGLPAAGGGPWEITKFSGAVSRERKAQLIENAEAPLARLRQARERANHEGAPPVSIGAPAWTFRLG